VTWKTVWSLTGANVPVELLKSTAARFEVGTYQQVPASQDHRRTVGATAGRIGFPEAWQATRAVE
jgi:hypothetical protein